MRNFQKTPSNALQLNGRPLRAAALDRYFDHAAYHFFMKYNGEPPVLSLHDFLARFETAVVYETLIRTHGSQKDTAAYLKVKKQTLNWKVKKQHILFTKQVIKQPI
jgi:DNA-binding NtrC family response regulator